MRSRELTVDRNLREIDSKSRDLGVEVGEAGEEEEHGKSARTWETTTRRLDSLSSSEERIVREVDSGNDMLSAKGDLLGLGEVLQL